MSDKGLLKKLEEISFRHVEVGKLIVDPEIISDMKRYVNLNREYKELEPLVIAYNNYKNILSNIDSSKDIIKNESDEEFKEILDKGLTKEQKDRVEQIKKEREPPLHSMEDILKIFEDDEDSS